MAFNGAGVFLRLYSWTNDAAANIKIRADRMDNETNGIASGLSNCITKDGQTTVTADLPMAGKKHTGVGDAILANQYASLGQIQNSSIFYAGPNTGTANALIGSLNPDVITLTPGLRVTLLSTAANSGPATFVLDGTAATPITKRGATPLAANDILATSLIDLEFDGTQWELLNPASTSPASVGTAAIQDNAVTYAKMQDISATARVLGRATAGAGDTEELTLTQVLDLVGSATWGDILFRGSAGWQKLGAGTSGQFFKTNGPGADPAYASISAGLTLLSVQTASSSSALTFSSLISGTYNKYMLEIDDMDVGASTINLLIEVSTDNGSSWKTTGYINNSAYLYSGGAGYEVGTTAVFLNYTPAGMNNTLPVSGQIFFANPNSTTNKCIFNGQVSGYTPSGGGFIFSGLLAGYYNTSGTAINAIRLRTSSGNIVSGVARLYGLQKA